MNNTCTSFYSSNFVYIYIWIDGINHCLYITIGHSQPDPYTRGGRNQGDRYGGQRGMNMLRLKKGTISETYFFPCTVISEMIL